MDTNSQERPAPSDINSPANGLATSSEHTEMAPCANVKPSDTESEGNNQDYVKVLEHPPRIWFGPTFAINQTADRIGFPPPDPTEIKCALNHAYGLMDLAKRLLQLDAGQLEVVFGIAKYGTGQLSRFCYQVNWLCSIDTTQVTNGDAVTLVKNFHNAIAGRKNSDQSDLDMPVLSEHLSQIVAVSEKLHREAYGGSRNPSGMVVQIGEARIGVPKRIALPPPIEEKTEPLTTIGLVDEVGWSSRKTKIKKQNDKCVGVRFDVDQHLETLCKQMVARNWCRTELESHIDRYGKETITLISAKAIQLPLFDN